MLKEVKQMYEKYPFPDRDISSETKADQLSRLRWILMCLPHLKHSLDFPKNSAILDSGCGTGDFTCSLGYSGAKILGIDGSHNSIKKARKYLIKLGLNNISFEQKDLENLSLKRKFDYIFCIGVLHHNKNPYKLYLKLLEHLKPNGHIILGLYSKYPCLGYHLKHSLLKTIGGKDLEKRMTLAKKIFKRKKEYSEEELASIADHYAHPFVSSHSIEEILKWFKGTDIKYTGSLMPIEISYYPSIFKEFFNSRKNKANFRYNQLVKSNNLKWLDQSRVIRLLIELSWSIIKNGKFFYIGGQKITKLDDDLKR